MTSKKQFDLQAEKNLLFQTLKGLKKHLESSKEASSLFQQFEKTASQLVDHADDLEKHLTHEKGLNYSLKESLNRFLVIQNLCELIGRSKKVQNILESLLSIANRALPFSSAIIYLHHQASGDYTIGLEQNLDDQHRSIIQSYFDEGIISWMMSEKRAVVVPYLKDLKRDTTASHAGFVIVPLLAASNKVGFMGLWRNTVQDIRGSIQLEMLELLAKQAAVAIENGQLYEELLHTNDLLKKSQLQVVNSEKMAAVGVLASGVAHEINNPLQVILSRVQLLSRKVEKEENKASLKLIEKEAHQISNIVGSILRYAQNQNHPNLQHCNLHPIINDTLMLVNTKLVLHNIKVSCHFEEGTPNLLMNPGEVEQVLLNLFENACHAMKNGGNLMVRIYSKDEFVHIDIEDTGYGIPKELLTRIFDPFFTTKPPNEGTGLGLFLCYGIMERHKGNIQVESTPGKGTKFILRFPKRY